MFLVQLQPGTLVSWHSPSLSPLIFLSSLYCPRSNNSPNSPNTYFAKNCHDLKSVPPSRQKSKKENTLKYYSHYSRKCRNTAAIITFQNKWTLTQIFKTLMQPRGCNYTVFGFDHFLMPTNIPVGMEAERRLFLF